jgi:hypothetical protein
LERDPDPCTRADFIMAEMSHGTGDQTLEDGGLQELCAILKAGCIVDLSFRGPWNICQDWWTVHFGQRSMHIPCGLEVEYTDLMQAIGESTNLEKILLRQDFSLCNDVLCVQLCKALCKNHSVSDLTIYLTVDGSQDCQPTFDILLDQVVVMLESNVGLKDFTFFAPSHHAPTFWSSDGFANALERNRTLESFCMSVPSEQELARLIRPLVADGNGQQKNSTLIKLNLMLSKSVDVESDTVAANVLGKMLQNNSSLKEFSFGRRSLWYSVDSFAEALETNQTLEHLELNGIFLNLQRLLQPLTVDANGQQRNATLLKLSLRWSIFVKEDDMQFHTSIVDPLTKMLQSNSSLKELDLSANKGFTESDVCALIKSLESNHSLEVLDFSFCDGVSGSVFPAIMDMLLVNKTLKDISLSNTELGREGKSEIVQQELRKNAVYILLKELPVVNVTSARVFLCGYPYAGKIVVVHQNITYFNIVYEFFLLVMTQFHYSFCGKLNGTVEYPKINVNLSYYVHVWFMGQQNDLKIKCSKKLMKVEGLLHKTYGIFVNDYYFANPCFGYRLAHIVVHIT